MSMSFLSTPKMSKQKKGSTGRVPKAMPEINQVIFSNPGVTLSPVTGGLVRSLLELKKSAWQVRH